MNGIGRSNEQRPRERQHGKISNERAHGKRSAKWPTKDYREIENGKRPCERMHGKTTVKKSARNRPREGEHGRRPCNTENTEHHGVNPRRKSVLKKAPATEHTEKNPSENSHGGKPVKERTVKASAEERTDLAPAMELTEEAPAKNARKSPCKTAQIFCERAHGRNPYEGAHRKITMEKSTTRNLVKGSTNGDPANLSTTEITLSEREHLKSPRKRTQKKISSEKPHRKNP